jgi:hypothetical protein
VSVVLPPAAAPLLVALPLARLLPGAPLVLLPSPTVWLPCANACCCYAKPIANTDATTMDEMNSAYSAVMCLLNIGEQTLSIAFIIL